MNRWLVGMVMVVALIQAAGCSEVSVSGKTAKDVFQDPQTLALVEAACHGDIPKIDALVKQGANVNATGYRDVSVLAWAMACKNYDGVERLLELGANPNFKMKQTGDDSPMWLAAGSSDPHFLPLMLAHGGDPNIRSGYQTALMIAIEQGRDENINLLIKAGVDLNAHNAVGFSAADAALAIGRLDYVCKLLENGYSFQLQQLANGLVRFGKSSPYYSYKLTALALLAKKGIRPKPVVPHIIPPPPEIK